MPHALPALLLCSLFALAEAGQAFAHEPGSRLYQQWKNADADRDGRLTRSEARSLPGLASRFQALDADRDGVLSPEEVRASRARSHPRRSAASGSATLLATADRDGDGLLAREEVDALLPRLAGRFGEIDADADGRLSRAELEAWLAARRALRSSAQ